MHRVACILLGFRSTLDTQHDKSLAISVDKFQESKYCLLVIDFTIEE